MVVVDGTNLLWAVRQLTGDSEAVSEAGLCQILGRYFGLIGEEGEVIFDGAGPADKGGFEGIRHLEVVFAGPASDSDTVIEEKIKASTAPKRLTVVSSDRRLRGAAAMRKATSVKAQVFWEDVQKQLSRRRQPKEPRAKREGLTESETDKWLEIFGLDR